MPKALRSQALSGKVALPCTGGRVAHPLPSLAPRAGRSPSPQRTAGSAREDPPSPLPPSWCTRPLFPASACASPRRRPRIWPSSWATPSRRCAPPAHLGGAGPGGAQRGGVCGHGPPPGKGGGEKLPQAHGVSPVPEGFEAPRRKGILEGDQLQGGEGGQKGHPIEGLPKSTTLHGGR